MSTTLSTPRVNEGFKQALFNSLQVDALRAMRYAQDPGNTLVSFAPGSMEDLIVSLLNERSKRSRRRLVRAVKRELDRDPRMQQFIRQYQPNLDAPDSVTLQVIGAMGLDTKSMRAAAPSAKKSAAIDDYDVFEVNPSFQWQLLSVYCKDETNGFLGTEWGKDEIVMGGFGLNALGKVQPWKKRLATSEMVDLESFKVGNFDDSVSANHPDRRKVYNPPLTLIDFPIFRKFPYTVTNTVQLVEDDDAGGINKYFKQVIEKAIEKVEDAVGEEIFGEDSSSVEENVIWKAIWEAITDFFKWIASQLIDNDEFPPMVTSLTLQDEETLQRVGKESYDLTVQFVNKEITMEELIDRSQALVYPITGGPVTETLKAHGGTYEITYQWILRIRQGLG